MIKVSLAAGEKREELGAKREGAPLAYARVTDQHDLESGSSRMSASVRVPAPQRRGEEAVLKGVRTLKR